MPKHSSALLALFLVGCAATQATPPSPTTPATSVAPAAPASRDLGAEANYGELLRGLEVEELDDKPVRGCLLARKDAGYRLEAELAVAVHPVGEAPVDLDTRLEGAPFVPILSRWGRHGLSDGPLALSGLTSAPPTPLAASLWLTDQGVFLRPTEPREGVPLTPLSDERSLDALRAAGLVEPRTTLFVTAERDVAISRLVALLERLAAAGGGPVVLGVALAAEAALPPPRGTTAAALRCPDGLPESDAIEGDLDVAAIVAGLAPLKERALSCLGQGDARGAAGGKLSLALRIGADGNTSEACMVSDETHDAAVAACVLALAKELRFEKPSPTGVVDVELPLMLRPNSNAAQPPVCAAAP